MKGTAIAGFVAVVVLIVAGAFADYWFQHATLKTVTFTVKDKAVLAQSDGQGNTSSRYMIYTTDGTFKDTDSFWLWKFNSSDLYGNLIVGKSYTCKVTGIRLHFTSTYRNIISCVPAKP